MEISSTADWQGRLLAFDKLDQAFENDKCRNSDTDFQRDGMFPLVSSKFNIIGRAGQSIRTKQQGAKWNRIEDALVTKKSWTKICPVPKRELNCCGTATQCLAYFLKSRVVDHVWNHIGKKRVPANRDSC